ncbi:hypothetical protein M885DRAFT_495071 [Pelagophyceae sp. CCMP2097]|nr:hypothetical protein M885DRAFT_495071 [Pelagophyceae sp. CCMP2097]
MLRLLFVCALAHGFLSAPNAQQRPRKMALRDNLDCDDLDRGDVDRNVKSPAVLRLERQEREEAIRRELLEHADGCAREDSECTVEEIQTLMDELRELEPEPAYKLAHTGRIVDEKRDEILDYTRRLISTMPPKTKPNPLVTALFPKKKKGKMFFPLAEDYKKHHKEDDKDTEDTHWWQKKQ